MWSWLVLENGKYRINSCYIARTIQSYTYISCYTLIFACQPTPINRPTASPNLPPKFSKIYIPNRQNYIFTKGLSVYLSKPGYSPRSESLISKWGLNMQIAKLECTFYHVKSRLKWLKGWGSVPFKKKIRRRIEPPVDFNESYQPQQTINKFGTQR